MGLNDIHSLSHSKWNCKYHIVFAPKYRRKVFYGEKKIVIGQILRQLCEWKGVNIIEAEVCPDHDAGSLPAHETDDQWGRCRNGSRKETENDYRSEQDSIQQKKLLYGDLPPEKRI